MAELQSGARPNPHPEALSAEQLSRVNNLVLCLPRVRFERAAAAFLECASIYRACTVANPKRPPPDITIAPEVEIGGRVGRLLTRSRLSRPVDARQGTILVGFDHLGPEICSDLMASDQRGLGRILGLVSFSGAGFALRAPEKPLLISPGQSLSILLSRFLDRRSREILDGATRQDTRLYKDAHGALTTLWARVRPSAESFERGTWQHLPGLCADVVRGIALAEQHGSVLVELAADYTTARIAAEQFISEAEIPRSGVVVLPMRPRLQTDSLQGVVVQQLLESDQQLEIVIERAPDRRASVLSEKIADDLERDLNASISPEKLYQELRRTGPKGFFIFDECLELGGPSAAQREKQLRDEIERARYKPDPEGVCRVIKEPPDLNLYARMQAAGIPIHPFGNIWMIDLRDRESKPYHLAFRGEWLPAVLDLMR